MKRTFSLRRGVDFQRVWDNGKSWAHPLIVLRCRANGTPANRFGFVVGKKIGKAAQRNRYKRWMREAVRHRFVRLAQGWDFIFIARAKEGIAFQDVDAAVEQVLQRARLLNSA
ncbi:MAG: ribonuclease P protein component [Chloroflexi bacterium]|nr:ribonuclease P protein component [Chloroflexota bacterium]